MKVNNKIKAVVLFLGIVCVLYGTKRIDPPAPNPGEEYYQRPGGLRYQTQITWPQGMTEGGFGGDGGFGGIPAQRLREVILRD